MLMYSVCSYGCGRIYSNPEEKINSKFLLYFHKKSAILKLYFSVADFERISHNRQEVREAWVRI